MSDALFNLISKSGCPFAQRSAIVLAAKNLPVDVTVIDVDDKPDWFNEISPMGKVPVLIHDGVPLVESIAINEYLEELAPDPPLMPTGLVERARVRFWVLFDETLLTPAFYRLLLAKDAASEARYLAVYENHLDFLERNAFATGDPFLVSDAMTLADIALITHLQRLPILVEHRGVRGPAPGGQLAEWIDRMGRQDAVRDASPSWSVMIEDMVPYVGRTANGATARDMMSVAP